MAEEVQTSDLAAYQSKIRKHHNAAQAAADSAIKNALAAGKLLVKAKAEVRHGEWLPFLESTGVNPRTAQRYMKLAKNEHLLKNDSASFVSVTKALEYLNERNISPPPIGCHLHLSEGGRELWIWPAEKGWYHYFEMVDTDDGGCDFRTSKRAISWEGIQYECPDICGAELINCLPFYGVGYRDHAMAGIANHGDGYDPLKPWTSPSIEQTEP
ncbi:MAG: DUF3102 domain-containing protein [Candidatus Thiodiazotropha endolucinida]